MFIIAFSEIPWVEFWGFIRAFIYGSTGGMAAVSMSYITNESTAVNLRNAVLMQHFTDEKLKDNQIEMQDTLDKIRKPTVRFIRMATIIHLFIGGISGMIAVSAFNPTANELQTFSIAVIAGVSGFAFLKRSALIDNELTEKILDVERKALEMTLKNDELIDSLNDFSSPLPDVVDEIAEEVVNDFIENEPLIDFSDKGFPNNEFEEFISEQKTDPEVTNADINFLRRLFYEEERTLEEIKQTVLDYEEL
ncbi:hypothetical protein [Exiguobacterium sp. S3]|uniref:hypothetical protein n=1 Tax=Exiguobacterium sp. S3 TaxID=483245 RepID=UPI001BE90C63|nr:hypothetical protein [Exiguobacterium sp. S3]